MRRKKKVLFIFGTRPEAIKLAPLVQRFRRPDSRLAPVVVVTAQHRGMMDQVLSFFRIRPTYDLDVMRPGQAIEDIAVRSLRRLCGIVESVRPEWVVVQGDTTTTFLGALSAYYKRVKVAHVEAGLRTRDKWNPFPEEINRTLTSVLADIHFAPTALGARNLRREGVPRDRIVVTGNTGIDALLAVASRPHRFHPPLSTLLKREGRRILLVTAHRRENFGPPLARIFDALAVIVERFPDVEVLFPVHPNPNVRIAANKKLGETPRIHLVSPLDYPTFVHAMKRAELVLTDSGGIQEEAPSLGKPVLVLREKTERPEAVRAGTVRLVGTGTSRIVQAVTCLLTDHAAIRSMSKAVNPYGDGKACQRIFDALHGRAPEEFRP